MLICFFLVYFLVLVKTKPKLVTFMQSKLSFFSLKL